MRDSKQKTLWNWRVKKKFHMSCSCVKTHSSGKQEYIIYFIFDKSWLIKDLQGSKVKKVQKTIKLVCAAYSKSQTDQIKYDLQSQTVIFWEQKYSFLKTKHKWKVTLLRKNNICCSPHNKDYFCLKYISVLNFVVYLDNIYNTQWIASETSLEV